MRNSARTFYTLFVLPVLLAFLYYLEPNYLLINELSVLARVGLCAAIFGVLLLAISKVEQFRKGKLLQVGPKYLSEKNKELYWRSYFLIIMGLLATVLF